MTADSIQKQMPITWEDSDVPGVAVQVTYQAVRDTASPSVSPHSPFRRQGSPMPLYRDDTAFIGDLNPGLSEPVTSTNVDTASMLSSPSATHLLSSPSATTMASDLDRTVGAGLVGQQKYGFREQTPSSALAGTTMPTSTPTKSYTPLPDHTPYPPSSPLTPPSSLHRSLPPPPTPCTPSLDRGTSVPDGMTDNATSNWQTEDSGVPAQSPCRCPLCVRGIAKDRAIERERKAREAAAAANLEQHRQAAIALENMQRDQQDAALDRQRMDHLWRAAESDRRKQQPSMEQIAQREEDRRRELWLVAENERRVQQQELENAKQVADQFLTQREAQCQAEIWQHFQTNRDSSNDHSNATPRFGTPNTSPSKAPSINQALLGREGRVRVGDGAAPFQNNAAEVDWDRHINVHREDVQRHSQLRGEYVGVHGGDSDESGSDDAVYQDCDHYVATLSYHGDGAHRPYKAGYTSDELGDVGARRGDRNIPNADGRTRDRASATRSDGTPARTASWDLVSYPESTLSSVDGNDTTGDTIQSQPPGNAYDQEWKRASAPPGTISIRRRIWRPSPTAAVTALRKRGFWRNSESTEALTNAGERGTERVTLSRNGSPLEVDGAATGTRVRSHTIASANVEVDRTQDNRNKRRSTPVLPSTAELGRQSPGRTAADLTPRALVAGNAETAVKFPEPKETGVRFPEPKVQGQPVQTQ